MGEVYRARDTRLDRTVAIKILPPDFAARPELRQRFEREARTISSLNHPHICALFDIGRQDEMDYLVMEYLEGETLAERLATGAMPVREAMRTGVQIAEALDAAHRNGVVHRDLKPANVILTKPGAKLLDFGLAKLREPAGGVDASTVLLTAPQNLTAEGTIVGTVQYMAPEQLEGKEADARTDIFALGAMLYEMLTGRRAFGGKSNAALISSILAAEPPPISTVQPLTPPALEHLIARCMAKDPEERWQSAADIGAELKWIASGSSQAGMPAAAAGKRRKRDWIGWAVAGAVSLAVAGMFVGGLVKWRVAESPAPAVRFKVETPAGYSMGVYATPAISPDGRWIAFAPQGANGRSLLHVRALGSASSRAVPNTDGAYFPFWSPDSRRIAFFANRELKVLDVAQTGVRTICGVSGLTGSAGAWGQDDVLVFSVAGRLPLYEVKASGGEPKPLTKLDAGRKEATHQFPRFLPDGKRYTFLARLSESQDQGTLVLGEVGSQDVRYLTEATSGAEYSPPGYLLFARGQRLFAQRVEERSMELSGAAETLPEIELPASGVWAGLYFSTSRAGNLSYREAAESRIVLSWFDRAGKRLSTLGEAAHYSNPALSPDGKKLAICRAGSQGDTRDIWLIDLGRETNSRFTFDPGDDLNPVWSPDGSMVAFTSTRKGARDIYMKASSGVGEDRLLLASKVQKNLEDWSRDGRFLLYNTSREGRIELWVLPLQAGPAGAPGEPKPAVQAPGAADQGRFSPDGRLIAYRSNESGRNEIYVQPFPAVGGKWQISNNGGTEPYWRDDGREIYYVAGTKIMAVGVKPGPAGLEAGMPGELFPVQLAGATRRSRYLATGDGKRFLVFTVHEGGEEDKPISVVLNWTSLLKH
jgi:Tol biopolymer transport system component